MRPQERASQAWRSLRQLGLQGSRHRWPGGRSGPLLWNSSWPWAQGIAGESTADHHQAELMQGARGKTCTSWPRPRHHRHAGTADHTKRWNYGNLGCWAAGNFGKYMRDVSTYKKKYAGRRMAPCVRLAESLPQGTPHGLIWWGDLQ